MRGKKQSHAYFNKQKNMANISKINLNGSEYSIEGKEAYNCKIMTFANLGISIGVTHNLYSNATLANEINDGFVKFIIKGASITNNNTIINVVSSAGSGAVYTALFNKYGAGKELTFIFINAASASNETPYYTVKARGVEANHDNTMKVPKSGYGANLMVKVMCSGTSDTSPKAIVTEMAYIGDDVLYNYINKVVAPPTTVSGLDTTAISNAFKQTTNVIVPVVGSNSCPTVTLNNLYSSMLTNTPAGVIHNLIIKNTGSQSACIPFTGGYSVNVAANKCRVIPIVAIKVGTINIVVPVNVDMSY